MEHATSAGINTVSASLRQQVPASVGSSVLLRAGVVFPDERITVRTKVLANPRLFYAFEVWFLDSKGDGRGRNILRYGDNFRA